MAPSQARATIIDVARVAGVSRQTVTRALNGLPDVSAATRDRVIATARELNYRPNRAAQGMVRGRGVTIGLVVEDLRNPYFPELASALSRIAGERGWSLILCDIGTDPDLARERLATLVQRVDALVLTGCRSDTIELLPREALRGAGLGIPLVMLDGKPNSHLDAMVTIKNDAGIRAALRHLLDSGRRRIAFVDSELGGSERRDGYRAFLAENNLDWHDRSEVRVDESHTGGMVAAERLAIAYPDLDAVLVYNDVMAIGVMKGFEKAGIAVPRAVAVIGFDGLDIGAVVTPELTTLSIDKSQLARHAVELVDEILHGTTSPSNRSVELTLVLRESA